MTILVTGGCGFVGINVAEELVARGERIVLFDRKPLPASALRDLGGATSRVCVVNGDIGDVELLRSLCNEHRIDRIVHAAAITADARREARDPGSILAVNVQGTVSILEAARAARCSKFVFVGSGAAYGKTHDAGLLLDEASSPSSPQDLYAISKFAAERTAQRLGALWEIRVVCVRLGSVCGPWEFATGVRDLLYPQLQVAQLAVRGEQAVIPAREVWRDWIYSRDVATAIAMLATAGEAGIPMYHLSSGIDWKGSFVDWCRILADHFPRFRWRIAAGDEPTNVSFVLEHDRAPMDITRIVEGIGFKPRFDPTCAYRDYIGWIDRHRDFMAQ